MKTTLKLTIAAIAAIASFSSCKKDIATGDIEQSGIRTLEASFAAPAKSTLDGLQPKFSDGDRILVSNGTSKEECTISVSGDAATFKTTLAGELTAVYPSAAAKLNGNVIEGILVSTVQDGTFANANIAKAEIEENAETATFNNQTALFKITPGAGASTKYVEVITAGPEIANSVPTGEETFTSLRKIRVNTTSADAVYVSILVPTGLTVRDLSFADGSNIKTANTNTNAIAVNTLNTVSGTGWDKPYVELAGRKWATMNIGTTSKTEAGIYFAWGDTTGQVAATSGSGAFSTACNWANAPFNNGSSSYDATYFASVKDSVCPDGVLALQYDAANVNWGGSWRMPTKDEFTVLLTKKESWDDTNNGYTFGTSPNTIFLPAAGSGYEKDLYFEGLSGYYWCSSLNADSLSRAYFLSFNNGNVNTDSNLRSNGQPVRALSE